MEGNFLGTNKKDSAPTAWDDLRDGIVIVPVNMPRDESMLHHPAAVTEPAGSGRMLDPSTSTESGVPSEDWLLDHEGEDGDDSFDPALDLDGSIETISLDDDPLHRDGKNTDNHYSHANLDGQDTPDTQL